MHLARGPGSASLVRVARELWGLGLRFSAQVGRELDKPPTTRLAEKGPRFALEPRRRGGLGARDVDGSAAHPVASSG